jgi:hypothetical protein
MTWRLILSAAIAGYGIAIYAAWEIAAQINAIAAVWTP